MKVMVILIVMCTLQRLGKRAGRVGNQKKIRDHPDYSIVNIAQNAEKCPGDLRSFAVTHDPVKGLQLMLV